MQRNQFLWPVAGALALGVTLGVLLRGPLRDGGAANETANAQAARADAGLLGRQQADLQAMSATFAAIARRVTPAVVNINSEQVIPGRVLRDPFAEMFGGGPMFREPDRRAQSLGSGVIVPGLGGEGLIVTNNHVVENANTITVTLNDRRRFQAHLVGVDPPTDLAVLRIEAKNLPVVQWSDSEKLQVGDIVLAVGSPFNLASTVTQGIISAKDRSDLGISAYEDFLQTDAAINPGNSGGALVDVNGNLVGINSAILSQSGGNQGIGLAIPSNLARRISGELVANGRVARAWIGIVAEPVTQDVAAHLKLGQQAGVLVTGIYENSPAAGLPWSQNGGDVIVACQGEPVDSPGRLRNLVASQPPGAKISLDVWQNGKVNKFTVTSIAHPSRAQGV
jgi:Do/DeqQ family serine protease